MFGTSEKVESIYRHLIQTIMSLSDGQLYHITDPALQLILRRSQFFHQYKKKVKNLVLRNRSVSHFFFENFQGKQ
jgi:hypothetical protein